MKQTQQGRLSGHFKGLGTVTHEMVEERAREIATIEGRDPRHFTNTDFLRAKQELTGVHQGMEQDEDDEGVGASTAWDEVPGTRGHRAETVQAGDEQNLAERLVEEGVEEAAHEQMLEGVKQKRNQG